MTLYAAVLLAACFVFSCRTAPQAASWRSANQAGGVFALRLSDGKTGGLYAVFDLPDSPSFSLSFKHSVNQSMVEEGYSFRDGELFLDWCLYSAFGAGVATTLEDGQSLSYTGDGKMLVSGFNRRITRLSCEVSTVYDHFLHIGGKVFNLTELGLKGKRVVFEVIACGSPFTKPALPQP